MILNILLIASCIQIITESLPISSSGHVLLTFLYGAPELAFSETLHALVHLPTLFIIAVLFRADWWPLLCHFIKTTYKKLKGKLIKPHDDTTWNLCLKITGMVITSNLITLVMQQLGKAYKKSNATSPYLLLVGFIITMILLFSLRLKPKYKRYKNLNFMIACIIGVVQGCALIPGISRFASTFVIGVWLGLSPRRSLHYTVFLATTIIIGEFGRCLLSLKPLTNQELVMLTTPVNALYLLLASFIGYKTFAIARTAALKNNFWIFGFYMIAPISAVAWYLR